MPHGPTRFASGIHALSGFCAVEHEPSLFSFFPNLSLKVIITRRIIVYVTNFYIYLKYFYSLCFSFASCEVFTEVPLRISLLGHTTRRRGILGTRQAEGTYSPIEM